MSTPKPIWPVGCKKPNTCERHRACCYLVCAHNDTDIGPAIDTAVMKRAHNQEVDAVNVLAKVLCDASNTSGAWDWMVSINAAAPWRRKASDIYRGLLSNGYTVSKLNETEPTK